MRLFSYALGWAAALLSVISWTACSSSLTNPAPRLPSAEAATPASTTPAASAPAWGDCAVEGAVDVLHHAIDLGLQLAPAAIAGQGELRLRARRSTSLFALDAHELRVSEVAAGGTALRFRHAEGKLCIELPRPLPAGAELALRLSWEVATKGPTPHVTPDQIWAGYRASAWMPTLQDPAQRATLALRLRVPSELKVVASGRRLAPEPAPGGLVTHSFLLDRPSPPFLYAFAAGRFDEAELDVEGVKLRALGPPGADLKGALAITASALRFLVGKLGATFPASDYTQAFVHGDAAQEAAGFSLLAAESLEEVRKDPTEDWIFAHELSHQWFAWLVPCADFGDFWLNEGFATFLVAAIKEQRWGRAAYDREVGLWRKRSAKVHAEGRDAPLSRSSPGAAPPPPRESELPPRGVTYSRGALLLHRLRGELGEATFWNGLRRYIGDRAGKGARSDDLRRSLEAASGRDLRAFFGAWVYSPAPDL
jgi:aminopeptidase N